MAYTTSLMDKLERWKAENAGNDAIHDDMAAQAYVEQFALETFERAEKQVRANKATALVAFPRITWPVLTDMHSVRQQTPTRLPPPFWTF